jgi:Protein of unknown function (DUF2795)
VTLLSYTYVMNVVSRTEIADCVEHAFKGGPVSSSDLIEFAADHGARKPVLKVLGRLPAHNYLELRDLWGELRDVPVES